MCFDSRWHVAAVAKRCIYFSLETASPAETDISCSGGKRLQQAAGVTSEPRGRSANERSECESLMTGHRWALWSPWRSHSDTFRHTEEETGDSLGKHAQSKSNKKDVKCSKEWRNQALILMSWMWNSGLAFCCCSELKKHRKDLSNRICFKNRKACEHELVNCTLMKKATCPGRRRYDATPAELRENLQLRR